MAEHCPAFPCKVYHGTPCRVIYITEPQKTQCRLHHYAGRNGGKETGENNIPEISYIVVYDSVTLTVAKESTVLYKCLGRKGNNFCLHHSTEALLIKSTSDLHVAKSKGIFLFSFSSTSQY